MRYKNVICPCCNKEVSIPIDEVSRDFDFNYSVLINSYTEFFDLIDMCPECNYPILFDREISDVEKEFLTSEIYLTNLNLDIDTGLKKWLLRAILSEVSGNYSEAGVAYTKTYDYMELRGMKLDARYIEKAASCFLSAAEEHASFTDALLAADALRRDGDMDSAKHILNVIQNTFEGERVDELVENEQMWIVLNETAKRYLDI